MAQTNSASSPTVDVKDSKASEHVENAIADDPTWRIGDTEIISSDNVRFRVPSYYLMYSSAVFRDMASLQLNDDGKRTLEFTDYELENRHVLRLYLDLVSTGRLGELASTLPYVKELAAFLDKWDCGPVLEILSLNIETRVQTHEPARGYAANPMDAFIVGAWAGSRDLCKLVLQCYPKVQYGAFEFVTMIGNPPRSYMKYETSSQDCLWDPTSWPLSLWKDERIALYLYALARAYENGNCPKDQFATKFEGCLKSTSVRSSEPLPKENTVSQDVIWKFGDYTLTSSDYVRFKTHDYKMSWASLCFPTHKDLQLTERFETAAVVRLFLSILQDGTLKQIDGTELGQVGDLVLFCQKWRCNPVLNIIRNSLRLSALEYPKASPVQKFSIAATLQDLSICQRLLTSNSGSSPSTVTYRLIWAPSEWPDYMMLGSVPKYILYALAHSCVGLRTIRDQRVDVEVFVKEFEAHKYLGS